MLLKFLKELRIAQKERSRSATQFMERLLQCRKVRHTTAGRAEEVLTEWLAKELPEPVKWHNDAVCWNDVRMTRLPDTCKGTILVRAVAPK